MGKLATTLANWFPLWVAAGCLLSLWHPPVALWFRKDYVTAGLAITMLAMGTTLTLKVSRSDMFQEQLLWWLPCQDLQGFS